MKFFGKIIIGVMLIVSIPAIGQLPDFSKVPNLYENDSTNITYLVQHGTPIMRNKVICWFPADSLTAQRLNEIADTINAGVTSAEKFIHAPLPWQVHPSDEPYVFYFRLDSFISHASMAGFVSIPFWRIKNGKAPWLHEAIHEMLNTNTGIWEDTTIISEEAFNKNMPLWLFEGMPDYIAITVSRKEHLQCFDVFTNSELMNTDSIFKKDMQEKNERTSYILSHIGEKGIMPELFSKQRMQYAPGFYHGSCSFVQYLAGHYDINVLLTGISSFQKEEETIENLCGKPLANLKKEWLNLLGISTD